MGGLFASLEVPATKLGMVENEDKPLLVARRMSESGTSTYF